MSKAIKFGIQYLNITSEVFRLTIGNAEVTFSCRALRKLAADIWRTPKDIMLGSREYCSITLRGGYDPR